MFREADKDNDGYLNRKEFGIYVEIGYGKACPPKMFDNVCKLYGLNTNTGINWIAAKKLWMQSQGKSQQNNSNNNNNNNNNSANKQSIQTNNNNSKLVKKLQDAFLQSDKDENGYLNESEFSVFVRIGFDKIAPTNMYTQVCKLYKKDTTKGIDWTSAYKLWIQSNPQYAKIPDPGPPKKRRPIPPKHINASNNNNNNINKKKINLASPGRLQASKSYDNSRNNNNNNNTGIYNVYIYILYMLL